MICYKPAALKRKTRLFAHTDCCISLFQAGQAVPGGGFIPTSKCHAAALQCKEHLGGTRASGINIMM